MKQLLVNEIFGPTVQGEGASSGQQAAFVRLGGCNLTCTWCDTPYTWDAKRYDLHAENTKLTVEQIVAQLPDVPLIVISGGEPLLQATALEHLCTTLIDLEYRIEIETNGTQLPMNQDTHIQYNVSPKLAHAGDPIEKRITPALFEYVRDPNAIFKFVVTDKKDLNEVQQIATAHGIEPYRVWIMPEGVDRRVLEQRLMEISSASIERGYNVTGRLHIQMFGGVRGK